MKNPCRGCPVYKASRKAKFIKCDTLDRGMRQHCPCVNCIVKVMCHEGCWDYMNFKKKANTYEESM